MTEEDGYQTILVVHDLYREGRRDEAKAMFRQVKAECPEWGKAYMRAVLWYYKDNHRINGEREPDDYPSVSSSDYPTLIYLQEVARGRIGSG